MDKFIEAVKNNPVLYDPRHEFYLSGKFKDHVWKRLASEFNFANSVVAKRKWKRLRECHREALRRHQIRKEQQRRTPKFWIYQKQMEFLLPFMKRKTPVGFVSTSADQDIKLEIVNEIPDPLTIELKYDDKDENTNEDVTPENVEIKIMNEPLPLHIENNSDIVVNVDELPQCRELPQRAENVQKEPASDNEALRHFFMSMYNITTSLPAKYQRKIRKIVFEAISQAENDADEESRN